MYKTLYVCVWIEDNRKFSSQNNSQKGLIVYLLINISV